MKETAPERSAGAPEPCPLCSSESFVRLFDARDRLLGRSSAPWHVVECEDCGVVRLHPLPGEAELASFHPETEWWESAARIQGHYPEAARRLASRGQARFAARSIQAPGPVLEIASAENAIGAALRAGGRTVSTFRTLASCMQDGARDKAADATRARRKPFSLAPGSFSGILVLNALEHYRHPKRALRMLRGLLAGGGRLVLKIPTADSWQFLLRGDRWNGFDIPRHPFAFGRKQIAALLEDCGLEVVRCRNFSLADDPPALATSLCPSLDPAIRRLRGTKETQYGALCKDTLYAALTLAILPLTVAEAACGQGATLMVEARSAGEGTPEP